MSKIISHQCNWWFQDLEITLSTERWLSSYTWCDFYDRYDPIHGAPCPSQSTGSMSHKSTNQIFSPSRLPIPPNCTHAPTLAPARPMHCAQRQLLPRFSSNFISLGLLSVTLFNLGNLHRPINIMAKIKLFGLLIASLAFAGCIAEETVDLGDANFDSTLESFETALVMFYAPW